MIGFLGQIGQKLADRWVALVAMPGLLYVVAVTVAAVLGQDHALSYPDLSRKLTAWAAGPTLKSPGGAAILVAVVLVGSVGAGLAATAGGRVVEATWTLSGRHVPARWLAGWRRDRSARLKEIADTSADPAVVRRAIERADRICVIEPDCPTWIGDRLRACHVRIDKAYGLDLPSAWPRLWLVFPDAVRAELGAARDGFSAAARLAAWSVLYLLLGFWWWPAVPVAVAAGATAMVRGRLATGNLADLIEAAVDLHGTDLAARLGDRPSVTPETGGRLTTRMRKDRWDPDSPLAD
ncbi:hypothetical protein GCM10023195_80510 [Actinoallomurus liliacearum]|uniref:Vegetative cell wall protein gp1 n=1 Tax=Actinoallomurus liliacearum TaxID=1080073 RepID=A0ABP8TYH2_9ACTN